MQESSDFPGFGRAWAGWPTLFGGPAGATRLRHRTRIIAPRRPCWIRGFGPGLFFTASRALAL
ncbi:hypothetical protein DTW89_12480 [Acidovorax sp. BoFeN1]|nr:hypothetical protein DTW89_12480 [Acidovorax sp. BoFeN1]